MILLIPLGGLGTRFKKFNYKLPKPLINVMGKPIICWLLDNLNLSLISNIVIPYNKELENYRFEDMLKKIYPTINFIFYKLNQNTKGAAETIMLCLKYLQHQNLKDQPILCIDGDNFYLKDIIIKWKGNNCIYLFNDKCETEIYSYVRIKENNIIDIKEKEKISNYASSGAYGFNSWNKLLYYCKYIITNNIKQKNEYYISVVIKKMLEDNNIFIPKYINIQNYICLGTPLHVRIFCNNFPKINALNHQKLINIRRYCFDLDNTLVTFPQKINDYTTVKPIQKNINFVKYLKEFGHIIIIYTARRMKTYKSNQGKVLANIGKITFDTLEKFDIPYDEIYFGKPQADFYIDDLAISSYNNLEKDLGFYYNSIKPRYFNKLENINIEIYKKKSDNLSGEIYYYNNIPLQIKDMFTTMINFDNINYKWYEMEKINGIPISKLYLAEELTIQQLDHIMNSIQRIHNCKLIDDNVNIYINYKNKLQKRYLNYDYSKFNGNKKIYDNLINFFIQYEKENKGKKTIIHGDTVLTNIIINQFGKIKFIDMRGKQGKELSIQGDWLYDWAKLYQSLIGYDEILQNINLNLIYKNKLIQYFKNRFIQQYSENDFNNLIIITKLLLFTLIPLHNNDKCLKYYNLINQIDVQKNF